jgi:hypothetical protein
VRALSSVSDEGFEIAFDLAIDFTFFFSRSADLQCREAKFCLRHGKRSFEHIKGIHPHIGIWLKDAKSKLAETKKLEKVSKNERMGVEFLMAPLFRRKPRAGSNNTRHHHTAGTVP